MDDTMYDIDGFEVGNVYAKDTSNSIVYYMAVNKKTLVTYMNGRFGRYTTKKEGHSSIGISVGDLCQKWQIRMDDLDDYMVRYFQPDEEAKLRARKEKYKDA